MEYSLGALADTIYDTILPFLPLIVMLVFFFILSVLMDSLGDMWDWIVDGGWVYVVLIFATACGIVLWIWWATLIVIGVSVVLILLVYYFIYNGHSVDYGSDMISDYDAMTVSELKEFCRDNGIVGYSGLKKRELIELIEEYCIDDCDYEKEIKKEKSSPKASVKNNIPTIKLTDIAGLEDAKKALEEKVILPLKHSDIYDKYGKSKGGGILLFGLPGTGKTMFAQAVATELDADFFSIKCSDIESKWIGESEQNVKKLFKNAGKSPRAVIFFDEFDSLGRCRSSETENGSNTVQEILTQMQGVEKRDNMLLVIAATNRPWSLDGALLRPGRFSEKIYIPLPDKCARLFILERGLKNCIFAQEVDLEKIAEILDGCNGADVAEFCEKTKMLLIRKEIAKEKNPVVTKEETDNILFATKSSVFKGDVDRMEEFLKDNI